MGFDLLEEKRTMKSKIAIVPIIIALVVCFEGAPALADWQPGDDYKMHFPQTPKPGGWDVEFNWSRLADDWMCSETGPVTDIHFWISWNYDNIQPIDWFSISIWSNNPVGPDGYSVPDSLLWYRDFTADDFTIIEWSEDLQGWMIPPPIGGYELNTHSRRFQVNIENIQDPFIQCEGTIYWLEIDFGPLNYIGWKETDQNWNDDAVFWDMAKWWEVIDPIEGTSIDLAFVITSPTEPGKTVSSTVDLTPYFDWGAISSWAGLAPPGNMGIWCPPHSKNFYFPSDSLTPNPSSYPNAWLIPGVHLASNYGPANVYLGACPIGFSIVTVPDRNSNSCTLLVEVPPANLIDQASDLNVIQISPGESKAISINDSVQTMVFLANCGGWVEYPGGPSPDQPLEVQLNYNDGTADTVVIDNIHPAGRLDLIDPYYPPSWIFVYCNEVFVCNPAYFDLPSPYFDGAHSEAWHWYALYPDTTKLLTNVTFIGIQIGDHSEVYISALSYSTLACCNGDGIRGDADGNGSINVADPTYLTNWIFFAGPAPPCFEEGDADGNGSINVADPTYLTNWIFFAGSAPPPCP
jgi:hypothetical protein